jgi:hypothetical protein
MKEMAHAEVQISEERRVCPCVNRDADISPFFSLVKEDEEERKMNQYRKRTTIY